MIRNFWFLGLLALIGTAAVAGELNAGKGERELRSEQVMEGLREKYPTYFEKSSSGSYDCDIEGLMKALRDRYRELARSRGQMSHSSTSTSDDDSSERDGDDLDIGSETDERPLKFRGVKPEGWWRECDCGQTFCHPPAGAAHARRCRESKYFSSQGK